MERAFLFSLSCIVIVVVTAFSQPANPLVGRWRQQFADGRTALAVFRADSSLDFFLNGKAFGTGRYYVRQDTVALTYPSCNGAYYGTYRLNFFAGDSVRFTAIGDTCGERRMGMDGVALGRIKAGKP